MSVVVHIPTPLRQHTQGEASVQAAGGTIEAILGDLGAKYPALTPRLFDNGRVRPFINLFLNDEDIRFLDNLHTRVKDGDELAIIPAVAGG